MPKVFQSLDRRTLSLAQAWLRSALITRPRDPSISVMIVSIPMPRSHQPGHEVDSVDASDASSAFAQQHQARLLLHSGSADILRPLQRWITELYPRRAVRGRTCSTAHRGPPCDRVFDEVVCGCVLGPDSSAVQRVSRCRRSLLGMLYVGSVFFNSTQRPSQPFQRPCCQPTQSDLLACLVFVVPYAIWASIGLRHGCLLGGTEVMAYMGLLRTPIQV